MLKPHSIRNISFTMVLVIVLSLFSAIVPPSVFASAAAGTTYYVDSEGGDDSSDGLSEETPWKSLAKVSATTFQPGDRILLKAGSEWTGEQLHPLGSGVEGSPITIDSYGGAAPLPKLNGAGVIDSVVEFYNQQYWDINNLEITNTAAGAPNDPSKLADLRGMHVTGQDAGVLKHFYIRGVFVHDVTGWNMWISGSTADDTPGSGIIHGAGWDGSKRTGGILFETLKPGATPVPTKFDDVVIEDSKFQDNSFGGVIFKQYEGDVHWASRDDGKNHSSPTDPLGQWYDPEWYPHTNITIRNNYFSQYNSDFACDTIYLTSVKDALVEHNVSAGAGTSAIEMYYTDNITVQYNEVYDTLAKAGGADSNAIDPDKESTNILIQYNYIHNTGDGILLCGFVFGTATVRYNIIQDAAPAKRFLNPHGDKGTQLVYNNIFYNTLANSNVTFVNSSGGSSYLNDSDYSVKMFNNIFYNAAGGPIKPVTIASGTGVTYDHNLYFGQNVAPAANETHAIAGDPKFVGPVPTTRGDALTGPILNFTGFKLLPGSLAIGNALDEIGMNLSNSTMTITDNGGKDFAGQALYKGKPDIGAFEYYGDVNSGTESITGQVKDAAGTLIDGAEVSLTVGSTQYSALSNSYGFYSIPNVPAGTDYTVTASKEYYTTGTAEHVNVVAGDTTSGVDLTVISTNPTGTIEGTVKDTSDVANPPAVAGAEVRISNGSTVYNTVTTDASGYFSLGNLPAKSGYTVTVSKPGYQSWTVTAKDSAPLEVKPGITITLADVYLSPGKPTVVIDDNFDSSATGAVPEGWTVTATVAGGSVAVAESPSATNKSALISQPTAGKNGNKTSLYKALDNLSGIVTVEYSLSKSNTNQYFTVPMVYGDNSSHMAVAVGMDNTGILYKDNGSSGTAHVVQPYTANTWYDFKLVLNTISKKFDMYIDGVKKVDQGNFRFADSTTNYLTGIDFNSNYNVTGAVYVDNVRISTGIAYPKNDAELSDLQVSTGTLTKVDQTNYVMDVPSSVSQITLTPTADSMFAKEITVNGNTVASGEASPSLSLVDGENVIPIVVTAEDGVTTATYYVTVNRTSGDIDNTLQSLTVSEGTLTPAFSGNVTEYTVSVPYSVSQISLTPTASALNATLKLNDTSTPNGMSSANVPLQVGENTITINVASADGTNFLDYTVVVTREAGPAPQLTAVAVTGTIPSLTVGGSGYDLAQLTVSGTDQYDNPYSLNGLTVTWAAASGDAYATVSGHLLTPVSAGTGTVTASVNGVTSSQVSFTVEAAGNNGGDGGNDSGNNGGNNGSGGNNGNNGSNGSNSTDGSNHVNQGTVSLTANEQGTAALSDTDFTAAMNSATADATGHKVITIKLADGTNQPTGLIIPVSLLKTADRTYDIQLQTSSGTVRLQSTMLNTADLQTGTVELRLATNNGKDGHPVIDLSLVRDGSVIPWSNLDAPVTVSIPYSPTTEELAAPDHIAIFYIDPQGNSIPVPNGHYDVQTGQVIFTTKHFSQYAVQFHNVIFTDLSGAAWASEAIDILAAKGVIQGKAEGMFDPQSSITRAEFITLLMRALELPQTAAAAGFSDVSESSYYYDALASAKFYGIVTGTGDSRFEPNKQITREDTFVMTARALQTLQLLSTSTSGDLSQFQDADDIAGYAQDSIAQLAAAGILQGDAAGIHPKSSLTRAEAAVMIYRILNK
jgi:S-layer homology domain.